MQRNKSVQDFYPDDVAVCFGCGKNNPHGLHIKTLWDGKEGVFRFRPEPYHTAFPGVTYGGLIASLIDCHSIATAIAGTYEAEGRAPGTEPEIVYVTGTLNVVFIRPTPIDTELVLRARIKERHQAKATVTCFLFADGKKCARGKVVAVRVPSWPGQTNQHEREKCPMSPRKWDNRSYRGMLQSGDGVITRVLASNQKTIAFETAFRLSAAFKERLKNQPGHLVFSERSRIARLGINIQCEPPRADHLEGDMLTLRLEASSAIPGYPSLGEVKGFFSQGLQVGRLVYCNPDALLTSDEVLEAIDRSELKLPASTTISSDGSILISPHKVICRLKPGLDRETIGKILFRNNGREILNRYQVREPVSALTIPPGEGVVTTCSMYLNDHYVALQSGFALGEHLPATILDPIKTRGINIYLEILNGSRHPIVNPLISARIFRVPRSRKRKPARATASGSVLFSFEEMNTMEHAMDALSPGTCHYLNKPVAVIPNGTEQLGNARITLNGPAYDCPVTEAVCAVARQNFATREICAHRYATEKIMEQPVGLPGSLALKYFPNILEHRDIINLACDGKLSALYFFEASCEHGPFLSEKDHVRLQEYEAFGMEVYWVSGLNNRIMVHTMRDGKGYFVTPDRLADFHKSMLFAFYGSNRVLSEEGGKRFGALMDALIRFWGKRIGIVTGGGSGVMEQANTMARDRGILSGANFLDITDQAMTTDVNFCQVFQSTCRHSRQKWFEIASFPIFHVGGIGTLEELGITLCNMKLSISDPVPVILFDTETGGAYWSDIKGQVDEMVRLNRAPAWIRDNLIITDNPEAVVEAYRRKLHLF